MFQGQIDGFNTFEILESVYNNETQQFHFKYTLPKISLNAQYRLVNNQFMNGNFGSNGTIKLGFSDESPHEIMFDVKKSSSSGKLYVENLEYVLPDSVKDILLDKFKLDILVKMCPQELKDFIYNDRLSVFNELFNKFDSVEDLAGYIDEEFGDSDKGLFGNRNTLCNHK